MFHYSKSMAGFYRDAIHAVLPADCVEISSDLHAALMHSQSKGKEIVGDEKGHPIAVDPPPLTGDQLGALARAQRDESLGSTDWLAARHRDEIDSGAGTSITQHQFSEVQTYRQALRDWPDASDFPDEASRPEPPDCLKALLT